MQDNENSHLEYEFVLVFNYISNTIYTDLFRARLNRKQDGQKYLIKWNFNFLLNLLTHAQKY